MTKTFAWVNKPRVKLKAEPIRVRDKFFGFYGYVIGLWDTGGLCVKWDDGVYSKSTSGFSMRHFEVLKET